MPQNKFNQKNKILIIIIKKLKIKKKNLKKLSKDKNQNQMNLLSFSSRKASLPSLMTGL